jgi:putative flippase GtrA
MLRWVLVGCVTVSIDWFIFVNLYPHIGTVALTNLISSSFATGFNYFAHHRWTFKSDQRHVQSGVRYGVALFGIYVLNTVLVKVFIVAGIAAGAAKLLAAAIQAPVNYFVSNRLVFKHGK